jgi:hypothetical protein
VVYILSKILLKYPTNVSLGIPSNFFQKYCPDISRVIPFKFFPEIFPKYSTNISPSIFLLRNTFKIIFQVPINIFFRTFLMLIRICMPPVSYGELYKLISLIQDKYMLISHSSPTMAINRGARASSHPTPSHFMATLSPPTHPLHFPHKHTLAQGSFGRSSIVRPPVLSLFVRSSDRSSDRSWFVHPFVRSFVRLFVQIIFFLPLCCRNSDRSFVRSFDHSSFVHSSYSSFVHSPYSSFFQIIFVLPLCCRNSDRSFVRSFDRSSVRS